MNIRYTQSPHVHILLKLSSPAPGTAVLRTVDRVIFVLNFDFSDHTIGKRAS